jgi:hypothetical protein
VCFANRSDRATMLSSRPGQVRGRRHDESPKRDSSLARFVLPFGRLEFLAPQPPVVSTCGRLHRSMEGAAQGFAQGGCSPGAGAQENTIPVRMAGNHAECAVGQCARQSAMRPPSLLPSRCVAPLMRNQFRPRCAGHTNRPKVLSLSASRNTGPRCHKPIVGNKILCRSHFSFFNSCLQTCKYIV